jgi:RHS repeat-associated protein
MFLSCDNDQSSLREAGIDAQTGSATAGSRAAHGVAGLSAALGAPTPLCYGAAGLQPSAPWPMAGLCPMHRGQSPVVGAQSSTGVPSGWANGVPLTGGGAVRGSVAIAADGTLYTGNTNRFVSLTAAGSTRFAATPGLAVGGSPAIGPDGSAYMLTSGTAAQFKVINPNGTTKFNLAVGGTASSGPVLSADGLTAYGTSQNGKLVAMNTSSGATRWTVTTGAIWTSAALGTDGTIYIGSDDGLRAVNTNGTVRWTRTFGTGGFVRSSPAVAPDGTIYVGTDLKKLEATNPNGTARWSFTATGMGLVRSSPAIASDGTIYVGTQDKKVYAVNPNGTQKWAFTTGGNVDSSPAIGADGTVYIGSDDKKLYALKPDGTLLFSVLTGNFVRSGIAIARNGTVFVGSDDGRLWAFGPGPCTSTDATCDSKDNDCNGTIDEDYASQASNCGVGACARTGTKTCVTGTVQDSCTPGAPAANDTTCNGTDDNCNGSNDEGYVGTPTSCAVGACARTGTSSCVNGAVQSNCTPGTPAPSDATCNGIDDNCNGSNDEGYIAQSTSCGVGACVRAGATSCVNGAVQASCVPGVPAASDATCDGLDDNCNGTADESYVSQITSCGVGACARAGMAACTSGVLQNTCVPGSPAASDATCDGTDDNCSGTADEGYGPQSMSCGVGACGRTGATSCVNGAVQNSCSPATPASSTDATCDGIDDNCNGTADEGCVTSPPESVNLVVNGTFDVDTAPTRGQKLKADQSQIVAAPEMISHETADTSNTSPGALRVTIVPDPAYTYYGHNSGAIVPLANNALEGSGNWVQVRFRAKSVSGATLLTVTRLWGGGWAAVGLSNHWESYDVSVPLGYDTDAMIFSLNGDAGVFLIDDIEVIAIPTLAVNGNFDANIVPVTGVKVEGTNPVGAPEFVSYSTDTWSGTGGSLRVSVANQPGFTFHSHTSGAVIPLSATVPAGTWLRVGFFAKRLSGGSLVDTRRLWGGSSSARVRIDWNWHIFQGYIQTQQDTSDLVVNLVPEDDDVSQIIDAGEFLLDEINVSVVQGPSHLVRCGQYSHERCEPACAATNQCPPALLDSVSSQPLAAYSVAERLRSTYLGPAIRVRRASDSGETKIGFAGMNQLNTAAVATFCGASDCYLATLYDQSGNERDLDQSGEQIKLYDGATHALTTAGSFPVLVIHADSAGVYRPDSLGLLGNPDMTVSYVGRYDGPGQNGNDISPIRIGVDHFAAGANELAVSYQPGVEYIYFDGGAVGWSAPNNTTMHRSVFMHAAGTTIASSILRIDGVPLTVAGPTGADAFNLTASRTLIGKHPANYSDATAEIRTVIVWNTVLGANDLAHVEAGSTAPACDAVQACINGDGCCPSACTSANDIDCVDPFLGTQCDPAAPDCGPDLDCRANVGDRFGYAAATPVCWDRECDHMDSPLFSCGTTTSRCGLCPACTPQCGGKSCGYDGCWGTCGAACSQGQFGCLQQADCLGGLACVVASSGPNQCLPELCAHPGRNPCSNPANAGVQTECGLCPACAPDCTGRLCGPAPNGCGICPGSTPGAGQFCDENGHIASKILLGTITVPPVGPDGPTTVGTLPGNFAVSAFGQATYTIPLQLPAGRNGIAPELGLAYNSAGGNGYLGKGWGLTGLSAIQRCLRTIAQDGTPSGITYTEADRFCLDGNRLVPESDSAVYGGDGTYYRTEMETFSRIRAIAGSIPQQPGSFEVRTRDGRRLTYGFRVGGNSPLTETGVRKPNWFTWFGDTTSQLQTQSWLLSKVEDRFGNAMHIRYFSPASNASGSSSSTLGDKVVSVLGGPAREYYPSRISYTSRTGMGGDRYVEFTYIPRTDVVVGYQAGVRYERTQLLSDITAYVGGDVAFQYKLIYKQPSAGADGLASPEALHEQTQLLSVQQCARNAAYSSTGLVCKPATQFEYDAVQPGFAPVFQNAMPATYVDDADADFMGAPLTLDVDGNGQDDVLFPTCPDSACAAPRWTLLRNNNLVDTNIPRLITRQLGSVVTLMPANTFVVDYDLDGRDDVLEVDAAHRTANGGSIRILSWDGQQLSARNGISLGAPLANGGTPSNGNAYLLDADGDRTIDLLVCTPVDRSQNSDYATIYGYTWQLFRHDRAQGFGPPQTVTLEGPDCTSATAIDINGDGREELLRNTIPGYWSLHRDPNAPLGPNSSTVFWPLTGQLTESVLPAAATNKARLVLDANGDGLADVVEVGENLALTVWSNTGSGFVSHTQALALGTVEAFPYSGADFVRQLARFGTAFDENSDGRTDLVVKANNSNWVLLRSLGTSFVATALGIPPSVAGGGVGPIGGNRFFVFDENHDGVSDLATDMGRVYRRLGVPVQRLAAVTNGLGARTAIDYRSLGLGDATDIEGPFYTQSSASCSYPLYCKHPSYAAVRRHLVWDKAYVADPNSPTPETNSFLYSYADAAVDLQGRGPLGFSKRTIVNRAANAIAGSEGQQSVTLQYANTTRDSLNAYPLVGQVQVRLETTFTASGRIHQASRVNSLPTVYHPSPHSVSAYWGTELQVVSESQGGQFDTLKQVQISRSYDNYGNLTNIWTQSADSGDHKEYDSSHIQTEYVVDAAHTGEAWSIRSPRKRVLDGRRANRVVSQTQQFVYAEDLSIGSGAYPFTGLPEQVITEPDDASSRVTNSYVYDEFGNVTAAVAIGATVYGQQTRSTAIEYDTLHMFPARVTDNNLHQVTIDYDSILGLPVATAQDGRPGESVVRAITPDGFGRLRRIVEPDSITEIVYGNDQARGDFVQTTPSGGPQETVFYDVLGRETSRELIGFDNTLVSATHYNPLGLPSERSRLHVVGADEDMTQWLYDALGRVVSSTLPDGNKITTCYFGSTTCTKNPRGFVSCNVVDEHGLLAHSVQPVAGAVPGASCDSVAQDVASKFPAEAEALASTGYVSTRYHYYPFGEVSTIVDTVGHVMMFDRDSYGRVLLQRDPDAGDWRRTYNAFGELERETDPSARDTQFQYDGLGRLVSRTDMPAVDSPQEVTHYYYDSMPAVVTQYYDTLLGGGFYGKPTAAITSDGGATILTYDSFGRVDTLQRTVPSGDVTQPNSQTLTRHHTYRAGRLDSLSYDSINDPSRPMRIRYKYNARGYLESLGRPSDSEPGNESLDTLYWRAVSADAYGQIAVEHFNNGLDTTRAFQPHTGRLGTLQTWNSAGDIQHWEHTYDPNGNLQTRHDFVVTGSPATLYQYDALDRLRVATAYSGDVSGQILYAEGYNYDVLGNITDKFLSDNASQSSSLWIYNYEDGTGRPHAVKSVAYNGQTEQYHYGQEGSLSSRDGDLQNPVTITPNRIHMPGRLGSSSNSTDAIALAYDAFGMRVHKKGQSAETFYLDDHYSRKRMMLTGGFTESLVVSADGHSVAEVARPPAGNEFVSYLHEDRLGSVDVVTDETGAVLERRDYEAFGKQHAVTGGAPYGIRGDYTGHELDMEFGLINMKARLYDPQIGRFLMPDPVLMRPGDSQGLNSYSYVLNRPMNFVDPLGLDGVDCDHGKCGKSLIEIDDRGICILGNCWNPFGSGGSEVAHQGPSQSGPSASSSVTLQQPDVPTNAGPTPEPVRDFTAGGEVSVSTALSGNLPPSSVIQRISLRVPFAIGASAAVTKVVGERFVLDMGLAALTAGFSMAAVAVGEAGEAAILLEEAAVLEAEAAEGAAGLGEEIGILRNAATGAGNYGLGAADAQTAVKLGESWVGEGATLASDGKTLLSADKLRAFRPPSWKPNLGRVQANFEQRLEAAGRWISNGHLDILLGPVKP